MNTRAAVVRRDILSLLAYLGLVFLVQMLETKLQMPTAAMAVYLLSSGGYVASIVLIHRVHHTTEPSLRSSRLQFTVVCSVFVVLGLLLGLIAGVNAKFFLGGTL